ncbi:hypothetical protein PVAP13_8KG148202 [Panicum virgatum]|uniref:Uncharacterized protein n=1 Tax=Panicum virgatum TaxID=38727 RepID=A0A8T0PQF1_PANVG|nr:hypothetical protein PVAP13_8KG148202 [Panicum virgatum]
MSPLSSPSAASRAQHRRRWLSLGSSLPQAPSAPHPLPLAGRWPVTVRSGREAAAAAGSGGDVGGHLEPPPPPAFYPCSLAEAAVAAGFGGDTARWRPHPLPLPPPNAHGPAYP